MILTKKEYFTFLLLILPCSLLFAQNRGGIITVEYQYQNKFFSHVETLVANDSLSVYVRPSLNVKGKKEKPIENDKGNWVLPIGDIKTSSVSYFASKKDKSIYEYTVNSNNKRFIVNDSTFNIIWKVDKTITKKIDKYNCYSATTTFRGRSYLAFFTPEIPISFGPYKFHNLPGLILQLENKENDISHTWNLKNIVWNKNEYKIPKVSDLEAPRLNAHQMFIMNREIKAAKSKRFTSRLPTGVTHSRSVVKNLGIEKVYEWETEDEEK
jgi:GLPGLI family protein